MILVTGGSGTNGRHILEQLSAAGRKVRAMVRQNDTVKLSNTPNIEYVVGDFDDTHSLGVVLAGIERAFLLCPSAAGQVARESHFIEAAERAGVRHIVKVSLLGADPGSPCRYMRRHGEAERVLKESGITFTILRPHYFMQNLLWYTKEIQAKGVFYSAFPADYKHSHVDARDNAAVAVAALTEPGHEGKIYQITGPEAVSYEEAAAMLSQATGRTIRYDSSPEAYAQFLRQTGSNVDEVVELDTYVARGLGDGSAVSKTVLEVTGREPLAFGQFVNDHLGSFGIA